MPYLRLRGLIASLLGCVVPLHAQILVDTFAGGKIRTGVPAQDVAIGSVAGLAWDASGNLAFCDTGANLIRRIRPDGILETVAGNGTTGFSGDGGPALAAALNAPGFPRSDAQGNLYFVDSGNNRIRRVDPHGIITSVAGSGLPYQTGMDLEGPALVRSLGAIRDLASDAAGNVYFIEGSEVIYRVTIAGAIEIFAGILDPDCYSCSDGDGGPARAAHLAPFLLAFDGAGNLYVAEQAYYGVHIRRINADGTIHQFAGYGQPAQVADEGQPAVGVYFNSLSAIAADAAGKLYLIQPTSSARGSPSTRIRVIDTSGVINTLAGGGFGTDSPDGPALPSGFTPAGLAVDGGGNVAFADSVGSPFGVASTLRTVTAQGTLKTLGGGSPKPAPDGTPLSDAWFLNPNAIALVRSGELLVAETGNCAIRKLAGSPGVVTTVAGTGKCDSSPVQPHTSQDLTPPVSLAVDSKNHIYFLDAFGECYVIGTDGKVAPIGFPPTLGPGKIAIDGKDRVYLMGSFGLRRVSQDGKLEDIIGLPTQVGPLPVGTGPGTLQAIGTDPAGTVYFTGRYVGDLTDSIFRVNDDGTIQRLFTGPGYELSLAGDSNGNFWLANGLVGVWNASGGVTFGQGFGDSGDGGLAQSARFNTLAIVREPSGNLYLLDSGRIRYLSGSEPTLAPSIAFFGIVNAASSAGGAIAPGELVSIFGTNLDGGGGTPGPRVNAPENNHIPEVLGRVRVLFNGFAGAITAVTPTQINVFVPTLVHPGGSAAVVVQVDGVASAAALVAIAVSAFGLFTADQSGSGQGAILNQDGSVNSAGNPAPRGSVVSFFGTGEGLVSPWQFSGDLNISRPYSTPRQPVTVTIGGQPAQVLYAGEAPLLPAGVLQINARIPEATNAGPVPVSVSVGGIATTKSVTVAVR